MRAGVVPGTRSRNHKRRLLVGPTHRDRKAWLACFDCRHDLASLRPAMELVSSRVGNPDGSVFAETNTIGDRAGGFGPHAPVAQAAVFLDVKGRQPPSKGLGDDQGLFVRCNYLKEDCV